VVGARHHVQQPHHPACPCGHDHDAGECGPMGVEGKPCSGRPEVSEAARGEGRGARGEERGAGSGERGAGSGERGAGSGERGAGGIRPRTGDSCQALPRQAE
jgi:hypothetical protein